MATNHQHGNGDAGNPSVTYDSSDLGARGILIFFVVLGVFAICMNLVVVGLWAGLSKATAKHDAEISPLAPKTVTPRAEIMMNTANINTQKFPEPRLQVNDTTDMQRFLLKETTALTADPWQDAQGNVHLPIDQAMKLAVTRIPVRAGGAAALPNYPGVGGEGSQPADAEAAGTLPPQPLAKSEAENPVTEVPAVAPKVPAAEPKEQ
jgi:hypothetical protein